MRMESILLVALGGAIGSVTRYATSVWAAGRLGADFPYGTLIVNVVGCYIIGFFMVLVTERYIAQPYWRLLVTTGFLGGLTTFSSFSYESFALAQEGSLDLAFYNVIANILIGFFATWLGFITARVIV